MPWEQSLHIHAPTSLWAALKDNSDTHLSRHFHLCASYHILIVNIFFICVGSETAIEHFLNRLSTNHPSNTYQLNLNTKC